MKPAPVSQGVERELTPAGNHVARLVEVVNIGTIPTTWQGEERLTHKIRLTFELCNELKEFKEGEGEKPYRISREFTYTMAEKGHLRPFIEGMIGTALTDEEAGTFKVWEQLGNPCLLSVIHEKSEKNGNTYANIHSAAPLPKGMEAPEQVNESRLVDVETITEEELFALPEFIRNKMETSEEWKARQQHDPNNGLGDIIEEGSPF